MFGGKQNDALRPWFDEGYATVNLLSLHLVIYQKRGGLLHKLISGPSLHIFLYVIIQMFSHGFFLRLIRKLTTVHFLLETDFPYETATI